MEKGSLDIQLNISYDVSSKKILENNNKDMKICEGGNFWKKKSSFLGELFLYTNNLIDKWETINVVINKNIDCKVTVCMFS